MDVFTSADFAFHFVPYLDTRSWLAIRQVNRWWREYFECECRDQRIMMALGRKLGGRLLDIRIEAFTRTERNSGLYDAAVRERLRALGSAGKFSTLHELLIRVPYSREDLMFVTDGLYDDIVVENEMPPFYMAAFLSDEGLARLVRAERSYIYLALDRCLEVWDVYNKVGLALSCPSQPRHLEFIRNMIRNVQLRTIVWTNLCCECLTAALEETPQYIIDTSPGLCLMAVIEVGDEASVRAFARRVEEVRLWSALVRPETYDKLRLLCLLNRTALKNEHNRVTLGSMKTPEAQALLGLLY